MLAHYFGLTGVADAWSAAFRIPNLLQNLFGEGALSASFIPAYTRLVAGKNLEESRRLAGAVFALLALVVSFLVLAGVATAPWLLDLIAPGFSGDRRELTLQLVRIFFPGAGLLVLSAWCLGVLNSHGRFFLSYAAPIAWNIAIIVALSLAPKGAGVENIAVWGAWGAVAGSALQMLVQFPTALSLLGGLRPQLARGNAHLRQVVRTFLPALTSRGVVQISAYIDTLIASLLPIGALAAVVNAQILYTLPVSLFGVSIAASELPAMSAAANEGSEADRATDLRARLDAAFDRLAFYVVPSGVAFATLGGVLAAAIFQSGAFTARDAQYVWVILAGASIGLLAATAGRLWSSAFFALGDTRTPLRFAVIRVILTVAVGYVAAIVLPPRLGLDPALGAVGLTLAGALAGWVEYVLLRASLDGKIGRGRPIARSVLILVGSAGLAAAGAWGLLLTVPAGGPILRAAIAVSGYGTIYGLVSLLAGNPEARAMASRLGLRWG